jgi:hypothetical protein
MAQNNIVPLRLALVLVFLCPTILEAAVALGPERAVTEPVRVIANGSQRHSQVATSGTETLVAWIDDTPGRSGAYIAALADDGTRIDGTQRMLSADAETILLTWTGESYLAFWQSSGSSIVAMTLDGERRPLSPPRTVLLHSARFTSNIAWIGGHGAVMAGRDLLVVDRQGNVLRQGIDVNPGGMVVADRVATDGQSYFAFWHAWVDQPDGSVMTDILVRRFTAAGEARDASATLVVRTPRLGEEWDVAFGGDRFALVTTELVGPSERILRTFLLHPATLQSTPLAPMRMRMGGQAGVEWVGDRFVAFWFGTRDDAGLSRMQTLTFTADGATGAVVDHGPQRGVGDEASEAWNGRTLIVAFTIRPFGEADVYAAVAWRGDDSDGPSAVALSPAWQAMPAVATNGQQSLIVWTEGFIEQTPSGGLTGYLRVAAKHATAGVADSPTVYLTESAHAARPSVVFTGTMYLVTWIELVEDELLPYVMMQRIDTNGAPIDAEPLVLARGFNAAMAWNGTHVMVGWGSWNGVWAARLTRDGEPFDAQAIQLTTHTVGNDLVAASNGSDFFFVWPEGSDGHYPLPDLLDLHAARVDASGASAGTVAVATGAPNQRSPAVASDGRDFLIAYVEDERLVTKKVLREGTLDGTSAADAGRAIDTAGTPATPTIAATGSGYVLAWESIESESAAEVFIAEVDRSGTVNDAATIVARSEAGGMWPIVATAGSTRGDVAYAGLQEDAVYGGAMRLFLRRLGQGQARGRATRH